MFFQLIYTCAFSKSLTHEDLDKVAQTYSKLNSENGITGLLLCKDGSAQQVLEGEKEAVQQLYEDITATPHVSSPLVLIKRMTTKREFQKWSMGFKNANESETAFKLCARSTWDALPANISPEITTIGRTFARVNGLA